VIFPLRLKLALLASLLLVAGIGTVTVLLLSQSTGALEQEASKRGRYLAESLGRNARNALLLQDDVVLERLLETVVQEDEVVAARLLDGDGALVAARLRDRHGTVVAPSAHEAHLAFRERDEHLLVSSRMTFDEVHLGEAEVVLDLHAIVGAVRERARRDLGVASGGLLLIGVLIAFWISGRITQPLERLRLAARALGKGDTSARVHVNTRDELADLSQAFNEMGESLSEKLRVETAFRRYVSDHVLQQVRDQPDAVPIMGERREITVLFIDIRRFTRLASGIEPEPLVAFLNEAFELLTDRLLQHGATVDKYIGDAVLAYFGAPIESPDHPERAVAAAIAAQRSVEERNKALASSGRPYQPLEIGIGIQTGMVLLGNIGSELKMDYTIIGDVVNVANRLQKLARAGEILITGDVAERVAGRARLESQGERVLEGRDTPVEIHRVLY